MVHKTEATIQAWMEETIKKVLHYIRRYRFFLIVSLVLALITVVLTLYVPILTGQAVDLIVGKGQVDFAGVYHICVKIGIAILLTMAAQWVMNVANNKITYSVVRDIRTDAFEKIQILPLSYIDSHSYGGIVSRVIADADQFADGLLMGFTQLFTGVITILGTISTDFISRNLFKLVSDNLFCFLIEYMNLFNIESELNSIARSSCCTGINSCRDRELSQIKV